MYVQFEVGQKPKKAEVMGAEVIYKDEAEDLESLVINKDTNTDEEEGIEITPDELELKPLSDFETKEQFEEYALTFGFNPNKSKKLENMYADLKRFLGN